jgi:hypothetical protein
VGEEPRNVFAHERRARAEIAIGGVVGAREQPWVDQQLEARRGNSLGARALRDHRGEAAAGRVAAYADARGIAAEAAGAREREAIDGPRILLRGGEAVLGAHAIVDRQHETARAHGEHAAERRTPVEVADHEAALVEIEQQRARAVEIGWNVEPSGQRALRARHPVLFDALERTQRRRRGRERIAGDRARLRGRERVQRGNPRGARDQREVRV